MYARGRLCSICKYCEKSLEETTCAFVHQFLFCILTKCIFVLFSKRKWVENRSVSKPSGWKNWRTNASLGYSQFRIGVPVIHILREVRECVLSRLNCLTEVNKGLASQTQTHSAWNKCTSSSPEDRLRCFHCYHIFVNNESHNGRTRNEKAWQWEWRKSAALDKREFTDAREPVENFRMTKLIEMKKIKYIVTSSQQATTAVAAGELDKVGRKVHFVVWATRREHSAHLGNGKKILRNDKVFPTRRCGCNVRREYWR